MADAELEASLSRALQRLRDRHDGDAWVDEPSRADLRNRLAKLCEFPLSDELRNYVVHAERRWPGIDGFAEKLMAGIEAVVYNILENTGSPPEGLDISLRPGYVKNWLSVQFVAGVEKGRRDRIVSEFYDACLKRIVESPPR